MWAAIVVFSREKSSAVPFNYCFPRAAITFLHTAFSRKGLVKKHIGRNTSVRELGLLVCLTPGFQHRCSEVFSEPFLTSGPQKLGTERGSQSLLMCFFFPPMSKMPHN